MKLTQLREKRAQILREADALKGTDGGFATDQARASFDAKMAEIEALDAQTRTAEEAERAQPAAGAIDQARAEAVAQERARVTGIQDAVRVAGLEATVAADMVGRGISLDVARAEIFAKMAARSNQNPTDGRHSVEMGEDARDKFRRGALNWLLVRSGMAPIIAKHEKVDVRSFDAGEFRGLSLMDLARESLVRSGIRGIGSDKMVLVGRAFMERSSTQSTSDFTYILENTMHKSLQAAYALAEVTWPKFCAVSSVSDFRAHNRYRMGAFSVLDTVKEDGEFKNKPITDAEKATITAATKGNIITISRQMIVNDDMNAFGRLMGMLGGAAARSVEEDIYTLLAANSGDGPTMPYDSVAMFHTSSHGANKTTGAALSASALDLDRVAMARQKDKDSNAYLNLRPAILLVDSSLGGQARVINQSQYDPDTVANKSQMKPNIVAGLFREIVDSPYVGNASFINSTTRRYLFADPSIAPVLEVAFLDGQSQPVIETQDGWRVDGTEMKIRFDYATAGVDHRGAVTNAGA